jgi:hypothetical protein
MKSKKAAAWIYIIIIVILLLLIGGYAYWTYKKNQIINIDPSQIIDANTPPPTNVKITSTTYPNTILTPGNVLIYDEDFLCVPGTPGKLDKVSEATKKQVFDSYHISYPSKGNYQLDKYLPLELGGSNDIRNLWPQGVKYPGYKEKDKVEQYLYQEMCNKKINITTAQEMIKKDWVEVYNSCCK